MASEDALLLLERHSHRVPLDAEQIRALVNIMSALKSAIGSNAPKTTVYTAILRALKAHVSPLPLVNATFAEVQGTRLQRHAEKLLAEGKPFPPELNTFIMQGLVLGFEPKTRVPIPKEKQRLSMREQVMRERAEVMTERSRLQALQADFQKTRASVHEAGRPRQEEPAPDELVPWEMRILPIPRQGLDRAQFQPLDPETLIRERHRFLKTRTEGVVAGIPKFLEEHRNGVNRLDSRQAALLETRLRHVKLLALQQRMRKTIWTEHQSNDRDGRRGKGRGRTLKQLQREFEKVDRTKQRQIETEEKDARRKRQAWMNAMVDHLNKFRGYHRDVVKRGVRAVNKALLKHHEDVAKNTSRAEREAEKARIQKLKDDDEEGYLELVRKTKNRRLLELLGQTDRYLKELGAVVKEERVRSGVVEYENNSAQKSGARGSNYYEIAHAIKEEVRAQPALLVGGTLKEYQIHGIQWMVSLYNNRLNGILADEMGLGKTIQTIGLIAHLMQRKDNPGPYLIIVPLSTISNWELEFTRWAPAIRVVIFKGDAKQRKRLYETVIEKKSFNVCLVTYEYVVRGKNFLKRVEWQHLIIDEGHRIKNHESRLSSVLHNFYRSRNRLLLTGTPLQNSLTELWSLLNFLLPNVFKSAESFESWFAAPFANMGVSNVPTTEQQSQLTEEESLLIIRRLHQVLRPFLLRRMKADVLRMGEQLPAKQEHVVLCEMSAWQKSMYWRIVKSERVLYTDKGGKQRYDKLSNPAVQLRKCVNHPYLFHTHHANQIVDSPELWRASGKFDMLDSIITKCLRTGHRLLIFNQMTKVVDLQERLLRYRNIPFYRLDGGTGTDERKDIVNGFNCKGSEVNVFLLTTRAGGLGVNLQTADTVIIFDLDWNPSMDQQAQDRAHRIGQQKEVLVLRMITAKSIEETVMERASFKRGLEKKIIRAGMFDEQSKDADRQAFLRELLRVDQPVSDEEQEDGLPTEEEINRLLARSEEEFEIFTEIDEERRLEINPNPRLLVDTEVPEWATKVPKALLLKAKTSGAGNWASSYGTDFGEPKKRRAATANVTYSLDQLSDRQYIKLMERSEAGEDICLSDAIREVSGRRRKRRRKAEDQSRARQEEDESGKRFESQGLSAEEAGTDTIASAEQLKGSPASDNMVASKTLNADIKSDDEDNMTEGGNITGGEQSFAPSADDDMIIEDDDEDDDGDEPEDKAELHNEVAELGGIPVTSSIRSEDDRESSSSEEAVMPPSRSAKESRRRASTILKDDSGSRKRKTTRKATVKPKRRRRRSITSADSDSLPPPPRTSTSRDAVQEPSSKRPRLGNGSARSREVLGVTTDSRDDMRIPRRRKVLSRQSAEPSENGEIAENEAEDGEIREEGELSDDLPSKAGKGPPPIPNLAQGLRNNGAGLGIRSSVVHHGPPMFSGAAPYMRNGISAFRSGAPPIRNGPHFVASESASRAHTSIMPRAQVTNGPRPPPPNVPCAPPLNAPRAPPANVPRIPPPNIVRAQPPNVPRTQPPKIPRCPQPNVPRGPPQNVPRGPPPNVPRAPPSNVSRVSPPIAPRAQLPNVPRAQPPSIPRVQAANVTRVQQPNISRVQQPNISRVQQANAARVHSANIGRAPPPTITRPQRPAGPRAPPIGIPRVLPRLQPLPSPRVPLVIAASAPSLMPRLISQVSQTIKPTVTPSITHPVIHPIALPVLSKRPPPVASVAKPSGEIGKESGEIAEDDEEGEIEEDGEIVE